jgi:integrase
MIIPDNHNERMTADMSRVDIRVLSDLVRFLAVSPLVADKQRPFLVSAVKRCCDLIGKGASDIPADPKIILRELDQLSPAVAGMQPQSFANMKSRVRQALRLAEPQLALARLRIRLTGAWGALDSLLPLQLSRKLSRFLRFAQVSGWSPEEIGDGHLDRFEAYLRDQVMLDVHAGIARRTARAWNQAADAVEGWPGRKLTVPPSKRTPYWIKPDQWPESLRTEVDEYLERLGSPKPFLEGPCEPLANSTIKQYRITFIELVSALGRSGQPVAELGSLRALLTPANVRQALTFFHRRAGGRVTAQIEVLASRAHKVRSHLEGVCEHSVAELRELSLLVAKDAPRKCCLTEKNRRLVEQTEDSGFVDRLVILPERLMWEAGRLRAPRNAYACARDAVAIELLLTCSMRLGNLIDLRIGESIRRYGTGHDSRWVIDIAAEKVKNNQPLRFTLPTDTGQLIELYLANWHPHCEPGSRWLFPKAGGGHIHSAHLSNSIAKRTRRSVGARITAHQFRHLAAELYLREEPNGLGVVSQHLGHKDYNTTRRYYAREQTRLASQRYHEILLEKRDSAASAMSRRRHKKAPKRP